jgi:hypothetical protein
MRVRLGVIGGLQVLLASTTIFFSNRSPHRAVNGETEGQEPLMNADKR